MGKEKREQWFEGFAKALSREGWGVDERGYKCPQHRKARARDMEAKDFSAARESGRDSVSVGCAETGCKNGGDYKIKLEPE